MSEIRIDPKQLSAELIHSGEAVQEAQMRAAFSASMRLKTHLVNRTDELGITDLGVYKNSFHAEQTDFGAVVYNDAPHSGIVEEGARPHYLPKEGIEALFRWCKRKLGLDDKEARSAAWAIAHNIAEKGLKGRWVMRDSQDEAIFFYQLELERELARL